MTEKLKANDNSTIPFRISFRDISSSDSVWLAVQERIERLEKYQIRATSCDVIVSEPHRHHAHGRIFHVEIRLNIPGRQIIINREPEQNQIHSDVFLSIRDAFNSLERRLEDIVRKRRGDVKSHQNGSKGRVNRLFKLDHYGFVETPDGRELYFDSHSLINGKFDELQVGQPVAFSEEMGEKGPQVTSLRVL